MVIARVINNIDPFSEIKYKGLIKGKEYSVKSIDMSSSFTLVELTGIFHLINSVCLKFFENDKEIDIYSDKRFIPYLK